MNYTQAQIDRANAVSLEDFLHTQGETLIKSGREYRWKEHDSLTVRGNKWFRHSQSKGGYPIDFVMEFYGKSFPEAVQLLTGESGEGQTEATTAPPAEFHLPLGHLNKAVGTQSTYRGLGSIDITAAVRSLLFIGKLKDNPTTRVLIHEKSSLATPGQSLAFSLGDEKGFEWIGAYDITADELLAGTDTAKTESKTAQAEMLILELLANGKKMPSAELEKAVNDRGISSRTMRTAKSRIGDRLITEKDGTAWVCYLRN